MAVLLLGAGAAQAQDQDLADCRASDPERSIAGCSRIVERGAREPVAGRARAYFNRGVAHHDRGDVGRAGLDYTEALRLNPSYVEALNNRSVVRYEGGDLPAALADATKAIGINPRYAAAYTNRAKARRKGGDLQGALADYGDAIRLDAANADAFLSRGSMFNDAGRVPRALADFDAALRLRPNHPETLLFRGTAHENAGDLAKALADYTRAIELKPRYARALGDRADLLVKMGDAQRAIADYEAALSADPGLAAARAGLERARGKMAAATPVATPNAAPVRAEAATSAVGSAPPARPAPPGLAAAQAENRIALVVGNGGYAAVPTLLNPRRDAARVAAALRAAGFRTVTVVPDAGRAELLAALNAFSEQAERADWAVVYFAGHGVEVGGVNYLLPVDARLKTDRDIGDEAVPLERVLQAIEPARKLRLVILDACRDNPLANSMRRTSATRSVGRGLARVEPDGGTLVAYAAKHGQTALDGAEGENSPFVGSLARHIATPGLEINKLFRLVRDDVLAATGRRQEPFVYGSLPGDDFFFVGDGAQTGATTAPLAAPAREVQVAALPPPARDPVVLAPRVPAPQGGNAPVNAPLVSFMRSNSGWQGTVSLPEPAVALSWRLGEDGPFKDTDLLDVIDQRTGRRVPSPSIPLDADTPKGTLHVRYVDPAGVVVGPFPIAFEPGSALVREQRRLLDMVAGSWLSFRDFNGVLLYYTTLVSYRCAIKELRIGLDKAEPDRVVALPPCDEANPFAVPGDFLPYMKAPAGTRSASAQLVFRDGSLSPVKVFKR